MVKSQVFFDSLKQDFFNIDKEGEYVIKKQQDILHFNQLDDTVFDKWMVDIAFDEQLEGVESDDDEMHEDEVQINDSLPLVHGKEEDKEGQSSHVKNTVGQMDDVEKMKPNITVTLVVHDDTNGNERVEVNMQESKPNTSLAKLIATYAKDSEQQPIKKLVACEDVIEI